MRKFLADVYAIWISERPSQSAAALAYYGMFSFAPVIYIGFTIAGIFIDQFDFASQFYLKVQNILGPEAAALVQDLVSTISESNRGGTILVSLVSFLALFFAASGLFFQVQYALNMIWRVPPLQRGQTVAFIRKRLYSFIIVIGVGLLLILAGCVARRSRSRAVGDGGRDVGGVLFQVRLLRFCSRGCRRLCSDIDRHLLHRSDFSFRCSDHPGVCNPIWLT
jgi:uncharacterized BrkB/YihY/UPF0761 family membrane protein